MNPISQPQIDFIYKLLAAKSVAASALIAADPTNYGRDILTLSTREASQWITVLKALPNNPDPSVPDVVAKAARHGTNSRGGTCSTCNNPVVPGAGYWYTKPGGGFAEHHKVGECGEVKPVVEVDEGFWKYDTASFVHVYMTQNRRLGGKVLTGNGEWVYSAGILNVLRRSEPVQVSPEDVLAEVCIRKFGAPIGSEELRIKAAEYGALHSSCIFCARPLTDERSDPALGGVGYGPECAKKWGLPWGNVTLTK